MRNDMKTKPTPNQAVGEWKIGDGDNFISFALSNKPNGFRRLMAWLFFGLRWIDFKSPKNVKDIKPSKGVKSALTKVIPKGRR